MTELGNIEALVGPLEKGREYRVKFGPGSFGRAMADIPGDVGQQQTSIAEYADAALAEAYAVIERLDSKRAVRAEILDSAWNTAHERAEKAEAEVSQWKALADERWEQCKHESRMRDLDDAAVVKAYNHIADLGKKVNTLSNQLDRLNDAYQKALSDNGELKDRLDKAEAEARKWARMLRLQAETGINAVASTEEKRLAMVREIADMRLADLAARYEEGQP